MAHTCPDCYQLCHCKGDIDDIDFGEWDGCEHYRKSECSAFDDESFDYDKPTESEAMP